MESIRDNCCPNCDKKTCLKNQKLWKTIEKLLKLEKKIQFVLPLKQELVEEPIQADATRFKMFLEMFVDLYYYCLYHAKKSK